MVVFSCLRPCTQGLRAVIPIFRCSRVILSAPKQAGPVVMSLRGARKMPIKPDKYTDKIWADRVHFFVAIAVLPCAAVMLYTNLFLSHGELTDIPEGYTPQAWEYSKHPITRFIAKYMTRSPEKQYETYMHVLHSQDEMAKARLLRQRVEKVMMDRQDVRGWYFFQAMSDEKTRSGDSSKGFDLKV